MRRRIAALLMALLIIGAGALSEEAASPYVENEWNYVDGAIDAMHGIPADAEGALGEIQARGVLRVGTEPYFPPQEFIDPSLTGQAGYVGADMELARLIARRMGVALEIIPMEFSHVLEAVAEDECDLVISALAYTPERAGRVTLSKGYHYSTAGATTGLLIRAADRAVIVDIDSLEGRDIVAQSGSLQEQLMADHVFNYREFRRVGSIQEVYDLVADGLADAATVNIESALGYIKANPDCGLALAEGVVFELEPQFDGDRVAARKGEYQLIYFVNGVIDELLESGEYRRWFEEYSAYAARLGL